MNISNNSKYNRRGVLKSTLGLLAGGLIGPLAEKAECGLEDSAAVVLGVVADVHAGLLRSE